MTLIGTHNPRLGSGRANNSLSAKPRRSRIPAPEQIRSRHEPPLLEAEDGLGQLQVIRLQLRCLLTDMQQRGLQLHTANAALAGDETGGIITRGEHDLVIAQRRRNIGRGFR